LTDNKYNNDPHNLQLSASLICANPLTLAESVRTLEAGGIDMFHLDIMDGIFVPNFGLSWECVKAIRGITRVPLELHLMICEPARFTRVILDSGAATVVFHPESQNEPHRFIEELRANGISVGVALSSEMTVQNQQSLLEDADFITIMTSKIGFCGLPFNPLRGQDVADCFSFRNPGDCARLIEVDGGIDVGAAAMCISKGARRIVCGTSSIFAQTDITSESVACFRRNVDRALHDLSKQFRG